MDWVNSAVEVENDFQCEMVQKYFLQRGIYWVTGEKTVQPLSYFKYISIRSSEWASNEEGPPVMVWIGAVSKIDSSTMWGCFRCELLTFARFQVFLRQEKLLFLKNEIPG